MSFTPASKEENVHLTLILVIATKAFSSFSKANVEEIHLLFSTLWYEMTTAFSSRWMATVDSSFYFLVLWRDRFRNFLKLDVSFVLLLPTT